MFRSTMEEGAFYPSHDAVDHYHHYEGRYPPFGGDGLQMLSHEYQLGKNFSNRMRRGAKSGRTFLYKNIFTLCKSFGIEPVVTLSHFEMPWYLAKKRAVLQTGK